MPNLMRSFVGASAVIVAMSLASAAGAVTLSTGVGLLGNSETNWTLTTSPDSTTSLTIVSGAQDYPGAWVVAPAGSNWITPYAGGGATATTAPSGEYDYSLTFNYNSHANVAIQWSSDNDATFWLNGNQLPTTVSSTGYGALVSFLIPAALFDPTNTFLVKVQNDPCSTCGSNGNPTGLLVSATTVTPLPAALPLFMSGLGALGLLGWRKKRKAFAAAA